MEFPQVTGFLNYGMRVDIFLEVRENADLCLAQRGVQKPHPHWSVKTGAAYESGPPARTTCCSRLSVRPWSPLLSPLMLGSACAPCAKAVVAQECVPSWGKWLGLGRSHPLEFPGKATDRGDDKGPWCCKESGQGSCRPRAWLRCNA